MSGSLFVLGVGGIGLGVQAQRGSVPQFPQSQGISLIVNFAVGIPWSWQPKCFDLISFA